MHPTPLKTLTSFQALDTIRPFEKKTTRKAGPSVIAFEENPYLL
jgi:hypothetical protein